MTLLSKSAILCANDLQTEDVEVPEWGGAVRVRSFTGRERDAFEASMVRGEGKDRKVDLTNNPLSVAIDTAAVNCKQFHRSEFSMDKIAQANAVFLIRYFFIDSLFPNLSRQRQLIELGTRLSPAGVMFFKYCDESVTVRGLNQMGHFMHDDVRADAFSLSSTKMQAGMPVP